MNFKFVNTQKLKFKIFVILCIFVVVLKTCVSKCKRMVCPTEICSIYIDENNQNFLWLTLVRMSTFDVTCRNGIISAKIIGYLNLK